jgi:lipoate-protein ligase A
MGESWRLVDSGLVRPPESAAMDEAILEAHSEGFVLDTLHFYRRSQPTISLGYFQKVQEAVNLEECDRRGVALVRRKSGGSSIYTDPGQLIYGLVVGQDDLPGEHAEAFRVVCTALARAIGSFGLVATYRPMNDVEVNGHKVSGNAQLRRKGSVLVHGTVLLDTNLETMDAVLRPRAVEEGEPTRPSERVATLGALMTGIPPTMLEMKTAVAAEFSREFDVEFLGSSLSDREKMLVSEFVRDRYGSNEWTFRF